jgi:hypothetical protein
MLSWRLWRRDVTLLDYAEITERRFASWRMGSVNLNRVNVGIILRFSESSVLDPFSMSGQALLALPRQGVRCYSGSRCS